MFIETRHSKWEWLLGGRVLALVGHRNGDWGKGGRTVSDARNYLPGDWEVVS